VEKFFPIFVEKSSLLEFSPVPTGDGKFILRGEVSGRPENKANPVELFGSGM
jgi:hypothetical protein